MEDFRRNIIINNISDNQKLIHIFLDGLGIKDNRISNKEIVKILYEQYKFTVTEKDIQLYFEPNIKEDVEDLTLQLKNLNLM